MDKHSGPENFAHETPSSDDDEGSLGGRPLGGEANSNPNRQFANNNTGATGATVAEGDTTRTVGESGERGHVASFGFSEVVRNVFSQNSTKVLGSGAAGSTFTQQQGAATRTVSPSGRSPVSIMLTSGNPDCDEKAQVIVEVSNPDAVVDRMIATLASKFHPESVVTIGYGLQGEHAAGQSYFSSGIDTGSTNVPITKSTVVESSSSVGVGAGGMRPYSQGGIVDLAAQFGDGSGMGYASGGYSGMGMSGGAGGMGVSGGAGAMGISGGAGGMGISGGAGGMGISGGAGGMGISGGAGGMGVSGGVGSMGISGAGGMGMSGGAGGMGISGGTAGIGVSGTGGMGMSGATGGISVTGVSGGMSPGALGGMGAGSVMTGGFGASTGYGTSGHGGISSSSGGTAGYVKQSSSSTTLPGVLLPEPDRMGSAKKMTSGGHTRVMSPSMYSSKQQMGTTLAGGYSARPAMTYEAGVDGKPQYHTSTLEGISTTYGGSSPGMGMMSPSMGTRIGGYTPTGMGLQTVEQYAGRSGVERGAISYGDRIVSSRMGQEQVVSERLVSSTQVAEEYLNGSSRMNEEEVRYVEVPIVQELIKEVSRKEIVEIEKRVPKMEIEYVERIVEVPEVQMVDRTVEVEQIQEVIREVRNKQVIDVPREVIRTVPKIEVRTVEKIVEVPGPIQEIPVPYTVEEKLVIPDYHDLEIATVVAQTISPIIGSSGEILEVPMKEYEPVLVPIEVPIPVAVSITNGATVRVETIHNVVNIQAGHYNSLLRAANHQAVAVYGEGVLQWYHEAATGVRPMLPATERVELVKPLSDEWMSQHVYGQSHVVQSFGISQVEAIKTLTTTTSTTATGAGFATSSYSTLSADAQQHAGLLMHGGAAITNQQSLIQRPTTTTSTSTKLNTVQSSFTSSKMSSQGRTAIAQQQIGQRQSGSRTESSRDSLSTKHRVSSDNIAVHPSTTGPVEHSGLPGVFLGQALGEGLSFESKSKDAAGDISSLS